MTSEAQLQTRPFKPSGFEPKFMKVGILTAALQELTPRDQRDADPIGQSKTGSHSRVSSGQITFNSPRLFIPPRPTCRRRRCSIRSPTPWTCDARSTPTGRVASTRRSNRPASDSPTSGKLDNLLHHDRTIRQKKHDFLLRVFDAAVRLGANAVCGFVGRNQQRSMDENLLDFEERFIRC